MYYIYKVSGESEVNLYSIFKKLSVVGPSILILDEIEIIAPKSIVVNPSCKIKFY